MKPVTSPIVDLWAQEYSLKLQINEPYQLPEQFQKLASLFSPGFSYYYVINFQNLHLDYISPEVEKITGIPLEEVTILKLVQLSLEVEVEKLIKKEMVVKDFFQRFLQPEDLTSYKLLYSYWMRTRHGKLKHMMHQAAPLKITEDGKVQHVISIHSDVTHLKLPTNDRVSFISLNEKPSYLNIDTQDESFHPGKAQAEDSFLIHSLTLREKEILGLLAKGYNAKKIAELLHLSFNTVRTHRRNMLQKAGCCNTTELVSRSLMEGII